MTAPQQRLAETLGRPAAELRAFADLRPAELDLLTDAIVEVRRRQREELQEAVEGALGHIPMLLRGPVRAAVGLK